MFDELVNILTGIAIVAIHAHENLIIVHEGEPARYLVNDFAAGIVMARFVQAGESVAIHRRYRLIVETVDRVRQRSLVEVATTWTVN